MDKAHLSSPADDRLTVKGEADVEAGHGPVDAAARTKGELK
jgi:hypothetical protein